MECAGEHSRVRTQPDVCGGMRRRIHLGGDLCVPAITGARAGIFFRLRHQRCDRRARSTKKKE